MRWEKTSFFDLWIMIMHHKWMDGWIECWMKLVLEPNIFFMNFNANIEYNLSLTFNFMNTFFSGWNEIKLNKNEMQLQSHTAQWWWKRKFKIILFNWTLCVSVCLSSGIWRTSSSSSFLLLLQVTECTQMHYPHKIFKPKVFSILMHVSMSYYITIH